MRQAKADAELTLSTLPATANSFSHGEILVVTVVTIALMHLDMHLSTKKQSAEFHPLISILSIAFNENVKCFYFSFQFTDLRYPRPLQSVVPPPSTCNPLRQPTHPGQPTRAQETTQLQPTADHPLSVPGTQWGCHPHQETGCCPTWLKTGYPRMPTGLRGPTLTPPLP